MTKRRWRPKVLRCVFQFLQVRYLPGINCSFSSSSPYFTVESRSKLALPSEFTLSAGARMTTAQDGALNQSGTGGSSAGRGRRRRPFGYSLAMPSRCAAAVRALVITGPFLSL